jgi:asparagine synthetase B (glutamine-hydrolysing)
LGVFLSGGTDSSLITLLADKQKKEQLKTISIFFNEKSYDEQAYQRLVLDKVSGQNFSHLVNNRILKTTCRRLSAPWICQPPMASIVGLSANTRTKTA